jgi:hypothetical protein
VIRKPVYDPKQDGNVFEWILGASNTYREMRRIETNAAKEAAAVLERLDQPEVENKEW